MQYLIDCELKEIFSTLNGDIINLTEGFTKTIFFSLYPNVKIFVENLFKDINQIICKDYTQILEDALDFKIYKIGKFVYNIYNNYVNQLDISILTSYQNLPFIQNIIQNNKYTKKIIQNMLFYVTQFHTLGHLFSSFNATVSTSYEILIAQALFSNTKHITNTQKKWIKLTNEKFPNYYKKYGYIYVPMQRSKHDLLSVTI